MTSQLKMLRLLSVLLCISYVYSFAHYGERIPNGDHIPHPCKPNFKWKGVGHVSRHGGGDRNQFGLDFAAAGHKWTKELCEKDSDEDGESNGVELGDAECIWSPGDIPGLVTGITHPGVCTPFNSEQCQNKTSWVDCRDEEFDCPAIKEDGVKRLELRGPSYNVPNLPTSYYCRSFMLPDDGDYHLIAMTPLINESRVMHHMGMLTCDDDSDWLEEPTECAGNVRGCHHIVALWTLGLPGECQYKEAGFRIGTNGPRRAIIQYHWTNPELRSDLWDSSGMTIYYTPKLRKYDAGTWFTGQTYLEIPPLTPKVVQQSTCSPRCTNLLFNGTVYLISGLNHMHYLGISESVKLTRPDGTTRMLTDEAVYSYDTPRLEKYDPPVELHAGDSLETVCTYRSMSRTKTAVYGRGTFDEMCFAYLTYYPAQAITRNDCLTRKEFELCDMRSRGCNIKQLYNFSHPETKQLVDKTLDMCSFEGECLHGCRDYVKDLYTNDPCFKDGYASNVIYQKVPDFATDKLQAFKFIAALRSCECTKENPIIHHGEGTTPSPGGPDKSTEDPNSNGDGPASSAPRLLNSFLLIIVCALGY